MCGVDLVSCLELLLVVSCFVGCAFNLCAGLWVVAWCFAIGCLWIMDGRFLGCYNRDELAGFL